MVKRFLAGLCMLALGACTNADDLQEAPVDLGDFSLSHRIVVAPKMAQGPMSRSATEDEWKEAITAALSERFDRYSGEKLYHFGISVEGYVLAQPGIPLILSPKSVLIINLSVWDDAAGAKLNQEVEQITVFESFSGGSIVGTGYTKSREEQLQALARNAAKEIQSYLERQRRDKGWFGPEAQIDKGSDEDKPRVAGQS
jgi:hypothetical protein